MTTTTHPTRPCPACATPVDTIIKLRPGQGCQYKCAACGCSFFVPMPTDGIQPTPKAASKAKPRPPKPGRKRGPKGKRVLSEIAQENGPDDVPELKDPQQELFCQYAVTETNPTQAALKAGYGRPKNEPVPGPHDAQAPEVASTAYRVAGNAAWCLMKKREIRARIRTLLKRCTDDIWMNFERTAQKLMNICLGRLSDYLVKGPDGGEFYVNYVSEMANPDAVKKIRIKRLVDDDGNEEGWMEEIELHDPVKAAAQLCRMLGWEKAAELEHKGSITVITGHPEPDPPIKRR